MKKWPTIMAALLIVAARGKLFMGSTKLEKLSRMKSQKWQNSKIEFMDGVIG